MSFKAVPTLQQLAMQEMLTDEDLVISALGDLPTNLFPPLFQKAFIKRQKRIVKAMVASWPFPCLPLGALVDYFKVDNFQAVLDGMDWLSNQNVRPRRCRLQVLNLQDAHHDFWEGCAGTQDSVDSPQTKPEEKDATTGGTKQPLKVVTECVLKSSFVNEYNEYFMGWLRKRRDLVDCSMSLLGYFCKYGDAYGGQRSWIP